MGFFKSKDEVPKLPKAPSLFDISASDDRSDGIIPELPSFPAKSEMQERFNQQMIKSAVDDPSGEEDVPRIPYAIPQKRTFYEEPEEASVEKKVVPQQKPQKETIFVKIDKFNSAQKSIDEIKDKISEISKAIDEMRKVKNKELEELNSWDEEMKSINLKLSKIDKGIFGEV